MSKGNLKKQPPKKAPVKLAKQPKNQIENSKYFDLIGLAIIILLGIIIYSNSFDCSFHFDDTQNILYNKAIQKSINLREIWNSGQTRFIPYFTLALNYHFGKLNVWGYHLVNLTIHLINACLVWWLTLLIFLTPNLKNYTITKHKKVIALMMGLLFVSHPLATQSVTYIVQRMASMAAMFYFLSVSLYLCGRLSNKSQIFKYLFYAISFLAAIAGILSKENAYTIPFAIILIELFLLQSKRLSINFKDYRIYILTAVFVGFAYFVLHKFSLNVLKTLTPDIHNNFKTITPMTYLFTQFGVIVKYIQLLILPVNQNLDYDFPLAYSLFGLSTFLSFLFLLSLIILGIFLFNKNRIISFGIFWFFLTLLIESSIIPISDVIFEHRTYLPSFGYFLILSTVIYILLWDKNKIYAITLFAIFIISNSYLTYERNKIWKDDFSLWDDNIAKSPNKARPYIYRGDVFSFFNKNDDAIKDYSKAIELNPNYYEAYSNRGNSYKIANRLNEALRDMNKAIELFPKFPQAFNNRGNVYSGLNKDREAINDYNKAIELNPEYADAYSNRGHQYTLDNKYDSAFSDLNKAIKMKPQYAFAYLNRGSLYNNLKKYPEALNDFNKAIELKEGFAEAYMNRGIVELNTGKKDIACDDWRKALSLGNQSASNLLNQFCH